MNVDCSNWYFCHLCRSESYIIDYFPKSHHAYTSFKTRSKRIFEEHETSEGHVKHFEKYYCNTCEKQCYSSLEFNSHCETIRHKQKNNITMNCELCNYSSTDKYKFERHTFTLKHQNAINGVQKQELVCELCNYKTLYKSQMEIHEKSKKHQTLINSGNLERKLFFCNLCNFKALSKSQMNIHEQTKKHKNAVAYEESKQSQM
jgi:hypothetical protein